MAPGPRHEVADLRRAPGELSFEARIGDRTQHVWMRTETPLLPTADAALAATVMAAMRFGGTLTMSDPVSPRVLRTQREFQAIQRAWSHDWEFGDPPLREVEVVAPVEKPPEAPGRVAAFFSGGVDSWATVLANPDLTDLIFVRSGFDLLPHLTHQGDLGAEVEARFHEVADALGLTLHVVETNMRELTDPLIRWEAFCACAAAAVALFLAPLFERVLIATDTDHETQTPIGPGRMVNQLWSTERLEIVDDGGLLNRPQRIRAIAGHPLVQRHLRVCWENPGAAYNCGRCRKCLLTMVVLETYGMRDAVTAFPPEFDLERLDELEIAQRVSLGLGEDVLDAVRAARRPDLERPVEGLVARAKPQLGLPPSHRRRRTPGPAPSVRLAVVVPAWNQARYLAGAVRSALDQEIGTGVGVAIVNDGCPDPETARIGEALRDAEPDRVVYLHQPNGGLSAARNAGIRLALARWPEVEAVFPLDADNLLSPSTLAGLRAELEGHPEAAWASPALEFFGAEEGGWQVPGPYLPYRELLANQGDAGSLIRRTVFDAGIFYDETMRDGFEDWELFVRATLAGFAGRQAGSHGFRYRRRPDSMLSTALEQGAALEEEIRRRHPEAYEPAALTRREHAEAPRFALVGCERGEVLLTAGLDLEPRRATLPEFAAAIAASGGTEPTVAHIPAVIVLDPAAALAELDPADLAETLHRLQRGLRGRVAVGLAASGDGELAALALRASALPQLYGGALPEPEATVEPADAAPLPAAAADAMRSAAAVLGAAAVSAGMPLPPTSHTSLLEHLHIDAERTAFPWAGAEAVA